jgi:hypothetical protein
LHNPLNVYNLIRHVAVGWSVVEQTLKQEKQERSGQVSKRVKKVLNRLDIVSKRCYESQSQPNYNLSKSKMNRQVGTWDVNLVFLL